jgi:hypothetical protein
MKNYAIYPTQKEAVRSAKKLAKEAAKDNDCRWTESVIMASGDTLHLTSTPQGKIAETLEAGWITHGLIHCSRRVADIAQ